MSIDEAFFEACKQGDLENVRDSLTSLELKSRADIHANFLSACCTGDLAKVRYYLTSPELVESANIHALDDYGFCLACRHGQLEVVKYLLISPELEEHSDIHTWNDWVFKVKKVNSTIQWVRDWHQSNIENEKLKEMVVTVSASKNVKRI